LWLPGLGPDDVQWHCKSAAEAAEEGDLVFVLGSGINVPLGLPDWPGLLRELITNVPALRALTRQRGTFPRPDVAKLGEMVRRTVPDPLLQAAALRTQFPENRRARGRSSEDGRGNAWHQAIKSVFSPFEEMEIGDREAISVIARIVIEQARRHRHKHIPVVTFNYDNLLERAIRKNLGDEVSPQVETVASEAELHEVEGKPGVFIWVRLFWNRRKALFFNRIAPVAHAEGRNRRAL